MVRWSLITLLLSGLLIWAGYQETTLPVETLHWRDIEGRLWQWHQLKSSKAVVFVTLSSRCPAVPRYAPRLNTLYQTYHAKGITFFGLYPEADETEDTVKAHANRMGFQFPVVHYGAVEIAKSLNATHVPQAFVLDSKGRMLYNGAIDSVTKREVGQNAYLRDALDAVVNKKRIRVARTPVVGCFLTLTEEPMPTETNSVTFAEHIAPILSSKCTPCHRPGDIGPFSLETYNDAKRWAREIQYYTQRRLMPPWKAVPGYGEFKNASALNEEEIQQITRWVEAGTPVGDLAKAPRTPKFQGGWLLGEPDIVVEAPEYELDGTGGDEYRYFVIPVELPENKAIVAIDIQPGNREVVHHANMFVDTSGQARKRDEADPKPGYANFGGTGFIPTMMLGGWVPGQRPIKLDEPFSIILPRRFDLVMQIHYFKRGKRERDRTRVGLYLVDHKPEQKPVQLLVLGNRNIRIPPGENNHRVRAQWKTPTDRPIYALAILAHMHLIARGCDVRAHTPDGRTIPLLRINDYDFNWQQTYYYKEPVELPPGTIIEAEGWYDNSADNPNNPSNPPGEVRYGEGTKDEMFYIFMGVHDPKAKSSYLIPASL